MKAGTINKTTLNGGLTAIQPPLLTHRRQQRTRASLPFIDQHLGPTLWTSTVTAFTSLSFQSEYFFLLNTRNGPVRKEQEMCLTVPAWGNKSLRLEFFPTEEEKLDLQSAKLTGPTIIRMINTIAYFTQFFLNCIVGFFLHESCVFLSKILSQTIYENSFSQYP